MNCLFAIIMVIKTVDLVIEMITIGLIFSSKRGDLTLQEDETKQWTRYEQVQSLKGYEI